MILLNFAHPLTEENVRRLEELTGQRVQQIRDVNSQIDPGKELVPQVVEIVEELGYTPEEWQTLPILINPPSLNVIVAVLLAELHGRMGYFPPIVRLRPVPGALPPRFEVAEVISLQEVRDQARRRRD
jgi:hypothetical protein